MDINKSLDFFMAHEGMSQADMARQGHLSPATISLIRNGHRDPSLKTLIAFASLFAVPLSVFIQAGEHG